MKMQQMKHTVQIMRMFALLLLGVLFGACHEEELFKQTIIGEKEVPVTLTKKRDGTYNVFIEVAAAQMTSEIQIVVNGQAVEKTYSVRDYADVILAGEYNDYAKEVAKLHLMFKEAGIEKGDKIALIGRNNTRWCISYIATITYGAVIVPILQDFNPNDVINIVNHS